ncbi:ferritin-like domain-containing protein [Prosthecomicrobium sp. N25]|uniref:ferritin-like domain-containing protein n=1 Tax=Prosthecomicrobium sp. N25 TaxID=3129254 RepID=UPI003076F37C
MTEATMGTGAGREGARSIVATGLRNAHALEKQAIQLIERQLPRLDDYPEVQARMRQHLQETRAQEERLDRMLDRLGNDRSVVKDMALEFMGNMAAMAHMPADDEILKNSFANLAFESYEIAAYTSLLAMAEEAGMGEFRPMLEATLQEEHAMADWIETGLPAVTKRFLSLAGRA